MMTEAFIALIVAYFGSGLILSTVIAGLAHRDPAKRPATYVLAFVFITLAWPYFVWESVNDPH